METHNFTDRFKELSNDIFNGYKSLVETDGTNNVLDVSRFKNETDLDGRGILKIEYDKASNDILFFLDGYDEEDFCNFGEYALLKLAWFYDDIVSLMKAETK